MLILKIISVVVAVIGSFIASVCMNDAIKEKYGYELFGAANIALIVLTIFFSMLSITLSNFFAEGDIDKFASMVSGDSNLLVSLIICTASTLYLLYRNFKYTNIPTGVALSAYHFGSIAALQVIAVLVIGYTFMVIFMIIIAVSVVFSK